MEPKRDWMALGLWWVVAAFLVFYLMRGYLLGWDSRTLYFLLGFHAATLVYHWRWAIGQRL